MSRLSVPRVLRPRARKLRNASLESAAIHQEEVSRKRRRVIESWADNLLTSARVVLVFAVVVGGILLVADGIRSDRASGPVNLADERAPHIIQFGVSAPVSDVVALDDMVTAVSDLPGQSTNGWGSYLYPDGRGEIYFSVTDFGLSGGLKADETIDPIFQLPRGAEISDWKCADFVKIGTGGSMNPEGTTEARAEVIWDGANVETGGPPLTITCPIPALGPIFRLSIAIKFTVAPLFVDERGVAVMTVENPRWSYLDDPTSSWAINNERERPSLPYTFATAPRSDSYIEAASRPSSPQRPFAGSTWLLEPDESVAVAFRSHNTQDALESRSQIEWLVGGVLFGAVPSVAFLGSSGRKRASALPAPARPSFKSSS